MSSPFQIGPTRNYPGSKNGKCATSVTLSSKAFQWHPASRFLSAEIAELGLEELPDVLVVRSARTEVEVVFRKMPASMDADGDVRLWPYERSFINQSPQVMQVRGLKIFND